MLNFIPFLEYKDIIRPKTSRQTIIEGHKNESKTINGSHIHTLEEEDKNYQRFCREETAIRGQSSVNTLELDDAELTTFPIVNASVT